MLSSLSVEGLEDVCGRIIKAGDPDASKLAEIILLLPEKFEQNDEVGTYEIRTNMSKRAACRP